MSLKHTLEQLLMAYKADLLTTEQMNEQIEALILESVHAQVIPQSLIPSEPATQTLVMAAPPEDMSTHDESDGPDGSLNPVKNQDSLQPSTGTSAVKVNIQTFSERYGAHGLLGEGGIGQVIESHDRVLDRRIAIKLLKQKRMSQHEQRRFLQEASTTAQLQHPNIVPVYDMGTKEDGQPWFSMKCVQGMSLEEIINDLFSEEPDEAIKAKYTQFRLLQTFVDVCNALEYAHDRRVIHRDIKPDNIMVGSFGEVLLMDWGVARLGCDTEPIDHGMHRRPIVSDISNLQRTQDGIIVGTPGFMAPEQARGDVANINERTDIWALGATLYVMLTGEVPFEAKTLVHTLIATVRDPVVPPVIGIPRPISHQTSTKFASKHSKKSRQTGISRWQRCESKSKNF